DLAELGATAGIETLGRVRDQAALVAQAGGELAREADGQRAGEDPQPLLLIEGAGVADEMIEGGHAVLAARRQVGQAQDEDVRLIQIRDARREARRRPGIRLDRIARSFELGLGDVIAQRLVAGALPERKLLRSDCAEADHAYG